MSDRRALPFPAQPTRVPDIPCPPPILGKPVTESNQVGGRRCTDAMSWQIQLETVSRDRWARTLELSFEARMRLRERNRR